MSAGALGGVAAAASTPTNRFAELQSADFIKVILSELSNQDPLEPAGTDALLKQLESLRSIETQMKLQDKLETLVLKQQIALAGAMIGKVVAALDDAGERISGLVTSVRINDGQALLELDSGQVVAMDSVTRIEQSP